MDQNGSQFQYLSSVCLLVISLDQTVLLAAQM